MDEIINLIRSAKIQFQLEKNYKLIMNYLPHRQKQFTNAIKKINSLEADKIKGEHDELTEKSTYISKY